WTVDLDRGATGARRRDGGEQVLAQRVGVAPLLLLAGERGEQRLCLVDREREVVPGERLEQEAERRERVDERTEAQPLHRPQREQARLEQSLHRRRAGGERARQPLEEDALVRRVLVEQQQAVGRLEQDERALVLPEQ